MQAPRYMTTLSLVTLLFIGCGGGNSSQSTPANSDPQINTPAVKQLTEGSTEVLTVQATDNGTVTYAIAGGADAALFQIDPQTGVLRFKTAPDYENPADSDGNNRYEVTVQATDDEGHTATQTITVTIDNDTADDGPKFTSAATKSVVENSALDFTVAADGAVSFALAGADQKRFALNATSGKLVFNQFRPDYERPSDVNRDNNYQIDIVATDDQNHTSRQPMTITVTDDATDNAAEANWVHVYKTGAEDGPDGGLPFGDDRNFTAETIGGDRVVHVGERTWQDSADNKNAAYTFDEAESYCQNLDYAGHSDWRVPNRHEMYEIVNYANAYSDKPTIDDIFQNSAKINYRTSENVIGHSGNILTNQAFVISFRDGASYPLDRDASYGVRCVRGATLTYTETVSKDADDIYRDPKTGFWWASPAGPESMMAAKQRCEALVMGGYDDWRLPNISEIHTIMPTVVPGSNHPYGAEPLLQDGGHQLWSSTPKDGTMGRYLDNYWNFGNWGDNDKVPVDADHPLGRDVMNDDSIEMDNANSVFSICIRGGRL